MLTVPISKRALGGPLWDHQKRAIRFGLKHSNVALLMEQGTGKTAVALALAGLRYQAGEIRRVLVFVPKSVLYVWEEAARDLLTVPHIVTVLEGRADVREELVTQSILRPRTTELEIFITNYTSALSIPHILADWAPDMVIVDESQYIKGYKSLQSKAIAVISKSAKFRMILTGTPIMKNPMDVFGQFRFLDPSIFGRNYRKFRDRYAIMGGYMGYEVKGYKNLKGLAKKMHSISFRILKAECLDLPPMVDETLHTTLEPEARSLYLELEREAIVAIGEEEIVAPIVLTKLLRLSQLTGGFANTESGSQRFSGAKLGLLKELLMDLYTDKDKKVVIFARFIPEIEAICEVLSNLGVEYVRLHGSIDAKTRYEGVRSFHENPEIKAVVAQIATGGIGIDLSPADTAIFYSLDYSYGNYIQAKSRLHRPGQRADKVVYLHLICRGTIDEVVMDAIKEKKDISDYLIDVLGGRLTPSSGEYRGTAGG